MKIFSRYFSIIFIVLSCFTYSLNNLHGFSKMVVRVSVTDLRLKPQEIDLKLKAPALSNNIGPQESQLLFGEYLLADEKYINSAWLKVIALEHEVTSFDKQSQTRTWFKCPGYIKKDHAISADKFPKYNIVLQDLWTPVFEKKDERSSPIRKLAIGTMLQAEENDNWWITALPDKKIGFIKNSNNVYKLSETVQEKGGELRKKIIKISQNFLGCPYVWGGRSPHDPSNDEQITGIDCSCFVNIVFRSIGLRLPQDSTPQFFRSSFIKYGKNMKPGDLIFFATDDSATKMCHVMLYLGGDTLIESNGGGFHDLKDVDLDNISKLCVRTASIKEYLGTPIEKIVSGQTRYKKSNKLIFLGSFLETKNQIQELRNKVWLLGN